MVLLGSNLTLCKKRSDNFAPCQKYILPEACGKCRGLLPAVPATWALSSYVEVQGSIERLSLMWNSNSADAANLERCNIRMSWSLSYTVTLRRCKIAERARVNEVKLSGAEVSAEAACASAIKLRTEIRSDELHITRRCLLLAQHFFDLLIVLLRRPSSPSSHADTESHQSVNRHHMALAIKSTWRTQTPRHIRVTRPALRMIPDS